MHDKALVGSYDQFIKKNKKQNSTPVSTFTWNPTEGAEDNIQHISPAWKVNLKQWWVYQSVKAKTPVSIVMEPLCGFFA